MMIDAKMVGEVNDRVGVPTREKVMKISARNHNTVFKIIVVDDDFKPEKSP